MTPIKLLLLNFNVTKDASGPMSPDRFPYGEMTEQRALDRANAFLRQSGIVRETIEDHLCHLEHGTSANQKILGRPRRGNATP